MQHALYVSGCDEKPFEKASHEQEKEKEEKGACFALLRECFGVFANRLHPHPPSPSSSSSSPASSSAALLVDVGLTDVTNGSFAHGSGVGGWGDDGLTTVPFAPAFVHLSLRLLTDALTSLTSLSLSLSSHHSPLILLHHSLHHQ